MPVLPDLLAPGLKVVFCGTAVGDTSAAAGAYYADTTRNSFWTVLHHVGLTPRLFRPEEYRDLPLHGIGLTDLVKARSGGDKTLHTADFGLSELQERSIGTSRECWPSTARNPLKPISATVWITAANLSRSRGP